MCFEFYNQIYLEVIESRNLQKKVAKSSLSNLENIANSISKVTLLSENRLTNHSNNLISAYGVSIALCERTSSSSTGGPEISRHE